VKHSNFRLRKYCPRMMITPEIHETTPHETAQKPLMSSTSPNGDTNRPPCDAGLIGRLWAAEGVGGQAAWIVDRHPQHRIL
jgi:hypothetical protein